MYRNVSYLPIFFPFSSPASSGNSLPKSRLTFSARHYRRAITYPLINLSTRSQVAAKTEKEGSRAAALRIIKRDGIVGLYDGLSSSLLGIAVTNGIYYLFFEEARAVVLKSRKGGRATLSTLESILVSAFAGAATSVISNPIWVINVSLSLSPFRRNAC
jgi:hypothetical protein